MSTRPITLPKLSATMENGHLVNWLKKPGDRIEKGEAIAEIESDKAIMELEAFDSGYLIGPLADPDRDYPVGTVLGHLGEQPDATARPAQEPAQPGEAGPAPSAPPSTPAAVRATSAPPAPRTSPDPAPPGPAAGDRSIRPRSSQYARRLARELGVDLAWVHPGDGQTIRSQDVLAAARQGPTPNLDAGPPWRYKPMLPTHRAVADNMSATLNTPVFSITSRVPTRDLRAFAHAKHHSMTLLLARALALSVRQHPLFNAAFIPQGLAVRERVDVGIAVDIPGGLFTPVLRDAAGRPLAELSQDWKRLKKQTLARSLGAADYQGATIYLSNLGMFQGVEHFQAIVPLGASAILAVGAEQEGITGMTLSVDHRVAFGADAARFMQTLSGYCGEPQRLD